MSSEGWARILKHVLRETRRVLGLKNLLRMLLEFI